MKFRSLLYLLIIAFIVMLPNTTAASSKIPSGTKVANILVEKKTEAEIHTMLSDSVVTWLAQDDITVTGEFETLTIATDVFSFNIDATVSELRNKTKRSLGTFFKRPKNVYVPLQVTIDEGHQDLLDIKNKTYIDYDALLNKLHNIAMNLEQQTLTLPYIESEEVPLETIAEVKLDIPKLSTATIDYLIEELNGVVIAPNELFSFLESTNTPEKLLKSSEESSFLGTGLYALFLQADFEIVARTAQLTLPTYGEEGINAEVNKKANKDLIVLNNSDSSYRLKLAKSKDKLTFRLEGNEQKYTYEIVVEHKKEIKPRTIYRYSKRITPGEHEVVQPGKDGLSLQIIRSIYEDDEYVGESVISRDLYLPTPLILLVSPDEPIEEDVEINLNEDDLFEEEMTVDKQGNIIRPDGSKGGSIVDLIPDNIEGLGDDNIVDEIIKIDKQQQQYEEFLDKLLAIYTNNTEEMNKEDLAVIEHLQKQIDDLNKVMVDLLKELIEKGVLSEDHLTKIEGGEKK